MVSFTVRMRFDPADRGEIAEILSRLTEGSRAEPGCVSYVCHFVDGEPATVFIYEQYADKAAVDHHRETPHFKQYAVGGLYQKMLDRQLENLIAVC
ncbi:MAG: antibiotic biosynthesis monooxygenase [Acidobacteria bacterium]|nr:antibiotic biosynthesis monooxygenase [Acidobacteriota bacterium]